MKSRHFIPVLPALPAILLLLLSLEGARADGGIVRLRKTQGPFVITIFTAIEPTRDSVVDVSVLVQRPDSNEAILDATVELVLTPPVAPELEPADATCGRPGGPGPGLGISPIKARATREQSSNKLLYTALIQLSTAGNWRLQTFIEDRSDAVSLACDLPVGPPSRRLNGLVPYLVLPPLIVSLFAINQSLRKRPLEKGLKAEMTRPIAPKGLA